MDKLGCFFANFWHFWVIFLVLIGFTSYGKPSKKKTSKLWTLSKPWGGRSKQGPTFFLYECLDISLMGWGVRTLCPK